MASPKKNVGLPSEFKINVEKPVELGDYLDETSERATAGPKLRKATQEKPVAPREASESSTSEADAVESPRQPEPAPAGEVVELKKKDRGEKVVQPTTKKRKPVKRKQINMSPKTLERFGELVNYVQEYSQQSDAAASEVMDAIISAHHDAMSRLRLGSVPARGRWGSPTAQAFKDALSKAFTEALVEYHSETSLKKTSNG